MIAVAVIPALPVGAAPAANTNLPLGLDVDGSMSPWAQAGIIIVSTYVLEDPTTIVTGLLIRRGDLSPALGILAVFIGIFSGDLALYGVGRVLGRRVLQWSPVACRLPERSLQGLGRWVDAHGWSAVLASRFVPGTRLPLYVAAGIAGRSAGRFALWTCLAVAIWVPVMVLLVIVVGEAAVPLVERVLGQGIVALVLVAGIVYLLLRTLALAATPRGRSALSARVSRVWRWEFWPAWVFYLPVAPWIIWLALRHRGVNTITCANPTIPLGGLVGESKYEILSSLPVDSAVPFARLDVGSVDDRLDALERAVSTQTVAWPLILKPDVGERGAGVRFVPDLDAARSYLRLVDRPILVQSFDPGPHEAGIFYYRCPVRGHGRIFSITDKVFSYVTGDGESTIEDLIWRHARFRMQAATFMKRLGARAAEVPAADEDVLIARAGNHCQGTMFCDGAHLWSEALEARIDTMARAAGVHFGRFDVRYRDPDDLRAGTGLHVVELNGITSESTNIYDPRRNILRAYATLYRQWSLLFRIGAANRRLGHHPSSHRQMGTALLEHYLRGHRVVLLSD